jgi:hypothetical protein
LDAVPTCNIDIHRKAALPQLFCRFPRHNIIGVPDCNTATAFGQNRADSFANPLSATRYNGCPAFEVKTIHTMSLLFHRNRFPPKQTACSNKSNGRGLVAELDDRIYNPAYCLALNNGLPTPHRV